MKNTRKLIVRAASALVLLAGAATGQIITQWNFNTPNGNAGSPTIGTLGTNIGTGTIIKLGTPNIAYRSGTADGGSSDPAADFDNAALDLSPWAQQGQNSGVNGVRFSTSTVGYQNIVVKFDIRHSNRMSRFVQFQYTTNGTNFITTGLENSGIFEASNDGDVWYKGRTADLSLISGVSNNPNFAFRIVAIFAPNTSQYQTSGAVPYNNGGRARFDMVTVAQDLLGSNPTVETDTLPKAACSFGVGTLLIEGDTRPGVSPPSTDITVSGDLTAIGGLATQQLFDDGTNGDPVAGDGRFNFLAAIGGDVTPGTKTVTLTVTDAQGRSSTDTEGFSVVDCSGTSTARVVISQIFGGGGNFGSPWNSDFVELHNRTDAPVDIGGWSLQYASDSAAFEVPDNMAIFNSGTIIPAGGYYLIQANSTIGQYGAPFIPDLALNPGFGVGQTDGKLALVSNTTLLGTECPTDNPAVIDFVGYGLRANCSEGGSSTLNTNVSRGALRKLDGCQDSDQNFADFDLVEPNPRSLSSTPRSCAASSCAADFDQNGGVDGSDVEAFFSAWVASDATADVDLSGGVDGGDVEAFFIVWTAGGCG